MKSKLLPTHTRRKGPWHWLLLPLLASIPSMHFQYCWAQENAHSTNEVTESKSGQTAVADRPLDSTDVVEWKSLPKDEDGFTRLLKDQKLGDAKSLWKVAEKHFFDGHGEITIKEETVVLNKGAKGTGIVAAFEVQRVNYELEFEARRTEGDDFFCGLTFPFEKQQATLILGGWGGSAVGISNINRFTAIENSTSTTVEFVENQWYKFRFAVTSESIELRMDGKRLFWLDPIDRKFETWWEQRPMEPLGFASWSSTGEIRNLRLRLVELAVDNSDQ